MQTAYAMDGLESASVGGCDLLDIGESKHKDARADLLSSETPEPSNQ